MAGEVSGVGGTTPPVAADASGAIPGEMPPELAAGDALDSLAYVASASFDLQMRSQGEQAKDAVRRMASERREKTEAARKALAAKEDASWWEKLTVKAGIVGAVGTLINVQPVVVAAGVTAAYSTMRGAERTADATGHQADASRAEAERKHAQDLRGDAIDGASAVLDLERRVMDLAAEIDASRSKASLTAAKA